MKLRFAFAGFRHGHVFGLLSLAQKHPFIDVVALSEEDEATREILATEGKLSLTHTSHAKMLEEVECDVVVIGDYYGARGQIAIAALKAGKHVIADKPLCTSLSELDEIEGLAKEKNLQVGLQLDLCNTAAMVTLRDVIASGTIGDVMTVNITAQHPLNLGVRPSWYFVEGAHGGTINDIGIHSFDLIPFLTGHRVEKILAARCWNAKATPYPHFGDCAQLLAQLSNGGGLVADYSYLAPTKTGFSDPCYWRVICHGLRGVASVELTGNHVRVATDDDEAAQHIEFKEPEGGRYLNDFLLCIEGRADEAQLTTAGVLAASREALSAQAQADAR